MIASPFKEIYGRRIQSRTCGIESKVAPCIVSGSFGSRCFSAFYWQLSSSSFEITMVKVPPRSRGRPQSSRSRVAIWPAHSPLPVNFSLINRWIFTPKSRDIFAGSKSILATAFARARSWLCWKFQSCRTRWRALRPRSATANLRSPAHRARSSAPSRPTPRCTPSIPVWKKLPKKDQG